MTCPEHAWQLRTTRLGHKPEVLHFFDEAKARAEYHQLVTHMLHHHAVGVWVVSLDPPEGACEGPSFTHHVQLKRPEAVGTYQL
jgi:hypothetical protein